MLPLLIFVRLEAQILLAVFLQALVRFAVYLGRRRGYALPVV